MLKIDSDDSVNDVRSVMRGQVKQQRHYRRGNKFPLTVRE